MEYVKDTVKPDAILWGGDTIPHDLDSLTTASSVNIMKNITKLVSDSWAE